MENYYYSQLNKQQQRIYQAIKVGVTALQDSFEVPIAETSELSDIFYRLRLDCPEIFYLSTFTYRYYENSNVVQMKPDYLFDKNKIREHQKAMKARVEKLCRPVMDKSDLEKEIYIHDFICENITYDKLKKQYSHEIIGALGQGVAVCEGIAKSVKMLCDYMNIPCIVAISHNNPEKDVKYRHAWNVIKLGGKWYHMDATFDNTISRGETRYDYVNLDDSQIFRDHEKLVYPLPVCSDKEHFYYKEKKLSFTKLEDVVKRSQQAIRKGKTLTFHWRGGYLTKAVLEELIDAIQAEAKAKECVAKISLNWPQAVLRVSFSKELDKSSVEILESVSLE